MAVPLEFANVVLHKARINATDILILDCIAASSPPNWAEDDHLVRVGFMSTSEAVTLIDNFLPPGATPSLAAIIGLGLGSTPEWISTGEVGQHLAAWLTGTSPGRLVQPVGYAMLQRVRPGCTWDDVEAALGQRGIACIKASELTRVLQRGDAICGIDLFDDTNGCCTIMLNQPTARRPYFQLDGRLLSDVLTLIASELSGTPLWPPPDGAG